MKLKILLLLSIVFLSSNFCFAENWVKVDNGELNVHLDIDSILENDNGIYYNVKYEENLIKQEVVATMLYKKDKLGIVQRIPYSDYLKSPETYSSNTKKKALFLTKIEEGSVHEHVVNLVKQKLGYSLPTQKLKVATEPEADFNPYMKKLQKDIKKNWNPPKIDKSKRVVALFKIEKSGKLLETKIKKSSGDTDMDNAAIKAVYDTAPFEPLPKEFTGKSIDIQFTFDYNVLGI